MEGRVDFDLDEAIPILERTPSVISALLGDVPEKWTRVDEGPDTWSPREVVAHLINGEHTDWIPRARIILRQEKYRRFDRFDRFADIKTPRPLRELLSEFEALRGRNVATLRGCKHGWGAITFTRLRGEIDALRNESEAFLARGFLFDQR